MSWGAVIAGAFCTLAAFDVLLVLGSAIGLTAVDPMRASWEDLRATLLAGGAWVTAAAVASTFFGALVGVRLSAVPTRGVAALEGLVIWAVVWQVVVVTVMVLSAIGAFQMPEVAAGTATPRGMAGGELADAGAVATWWLFGAAVLSALAGIIGGLAAWPDTHPSRLRTRSRPPRSVSVETEGTPPLTNRPVGDNLV